MDNLQVPSVAEIVARAKQMQQDLALAQTELSAKEVTGTAAGGLVTITMLGTGEIIRVEIDQELVDGGDAAALSDLVLSAIGDATKTVRELNEEKMRRVAKDIGIDFGAPKNRSR